MTQVLVVDSSIETCDAVAGTFTRLGYGVSTAHRAAIAIGILSRSRPELIVLNVMMPQLDGWLLLRWIRSRPEYAKVPILVHSNLSAREWALAQRMGATEIWRRDAWNLGAMCDSLCRCDSLPAAA